MFLQGLMQLKKIVNSELKYLNEKLVQGKHMSRGVLLLKNKSRKRSQKHNKRKKKKGNNKEKV